MAWCDLSLQWVCSTDLQPADVTLEAVEAVLFQVCDGMKGMIKPGKTLVRETIRCDASQVRRVCGGKLHTSR